MGTKRFKKKGRLRRGREGLRKGKAKKGTRRFVIREGYEGGEKVYERGRLRRVREGL
jgi:hypothetical protein